MFPLRVFDDVRGWEKALPMRPAAPDPDVCLRGHRLAEGGARHGYSQEFKAATILCTVCEALRAPGATWALIDTSLKAQVPAAEHDPIHMQVLVVAPPTPAGIGAIELRQGRTCYGRVELMLCRPCRRCVLTGLHVAAEHRRRGVGWVLADAALVRSAGYDRSMVPPGDDPVAAAFWARVGYFGGAVPAVPRPCSDQLAAGWSHPAVPETGIDVHRGPRTRRSRAH
jgi:ribosomal protein S18 acetylase RimI-like enzyme